MTLLAISFHSVHMHVVQTTWKEQREHHKYTKAQQPMKDSVAEPAESMSQMKWGAEYYTGGTFIILDWEKKQVVWQLALDGAMGFCFHDGLLYINMMRLGEIVALDGHGCEQQRISHKSLNNIHTVVPTERGFLLTSTGTDSIIELDQKGTLIYEWCALDHGYSLLGNGQPRTLDRSLDQRYVVYPTYAHTTHVNSACFADSKEDVILATLFHQGTIIAIDRRSGQVQTLVSGLNRPHDLRPCSAGGWIVSNTQDHQTLLLDEEWKITQSIALSFNWVQSSAPLADGSIIIADANNHRLVRVRPGDQQAIEIETFPANWRIYHVEEVPTQYAGFFQHPIADPPL